MGRIEGVEEIGVGFGQVDVFCGDKIFSCTIKRISGEDHQPFHIVDDQCGAIRMRMSSEKYRQLLLEGEIPNITLLN